MKKIILTIIVTCLFVISNYGQTTPPNKTRSNGTFTEIDHHLNVTKRFGIPTATSDNLFCTTFTPIMFNSTTKRLRLYDNNEWIDVFGYDVLLFDSAADDYGTLTMQDAQFYVNTPSNKILFAAGYDFMEAFNIDGNKSFAILQSGPDSTTSVELYITPKNGKIPSINTTAPTSSTDTGKYGEIRVTPDYIYICIDTNKWVRTTVSGTF
jgi:archaellin